MRNPSQHITFKEHEERKYPKGEIINVPANYKFQESISLQASKINSLIEELTMINFYGSLQIKFESGKIVHCKKEESIKL